MKSFLAALILLGTSFAYAGEPLFGYLYTTDLQPQGKWELEQWTTDREGQAFGEFHHIDMSTEIEYGVSDNFQVAFYANYMYANESGNSVRHKTEGIEIPYDQNQESRYDQGRFDGYSLELHYRVLSPYLDPIGLSFYIEPEYGYYENGIEYRAIIQKNLMEDLLILDANIWIEFENERSSNLQLDGDTDQPDGAWAKATYAELDLGVSYHFTPKWYAGLEFRNHNEYSGWTLAHDAQDHTAFFFGPNIHYASEHFFATLSVLRQVMAIAYTEDQKAEMKGGLLFGDEHTQWDGIRLILGFPFQ